MNNIFWTELYKYSLAKDHRKFQNKLLLHNNWENLEEDDDEVGDSEVDEEHRHPGFALVAQHLPGQITFSIQILMVVLFAVLSVTSRIEMLTVNVKLLFCNYYIAVYLSSL